MVGKERGGPAPAALLVGVVIGVLSSRVTWPSREQEPTCADVFVWSGCHLLIALRAGGPAAREGGGGNCSDPSRAVVGGWAQPRESLRCGWRRVETKEGQSLLSSHTCTIPSPSKNKNGGLWETESRGDPRPEGGKPETFGIQGL